MNPTHILASIWLENANSNASGDAGSGADNIDVSEDADEHEENFSENDGEHGDDTDVYRHVLGVGSNSRVVCIESHLSNLEVTPKLRQLLLLKSFSTRLAAVILKWKVAHLHPAFVQDLVGLLPFECEAEELKDEKDASRRGTSSGSLPRDGREDHIMRGLSFSRIEMKRIKGVLL